MVTITIPSVSPYPIQQYYVVWSEGTTGCRLLLGPFYMTDAGMPVQQETVPLNFSSLDQLIDEPSVSGQNPVLHSNAKGFLSLGRLDVFSSEKAFMSLADYYDPNFVGVSMGMSDATSFGEAFRGYAPFGPGRLIPSNVYAGYIAFQGTVAYARTFNTSYRAEANYAGSGNVITGHSVTGDFPKGIHRVYLREIALFGNPHPVAGDSYAWESPATWTETVEKYEGDTLLSRTITTSSRTLPILFTSPPTTFSLDNRCSAISYADNAVTSAIGRLAEPENTFGTLCKSAVQSIRYISSNSLENASDFRDVQSILPPLRSIKNLVKKADPRALADIYLWYKYAFLPTCQDVPEMINTIARNKRKYTGNFYRGASSARTYTNMGLSQTCYSRVGVQFAVDPAFHAKMVMQSWGVDLSFSNAWDLIPFSFVVDWFTHVGDGLSTIDYELDLFTNTYDFDYINCSNKVVAQVPTISGFTGGVTVSLYHRTPLRFVPFSYDRQPSTASSHILEMAALLVTK